MYFCVCHAPHDTIA